MIYELRTYELFNHTRKPFHDRFREHVLRLFKQYNIELVGAWETEIGELQNFVYILKWKDFADRQEKWDTFNNDKEWAKIKAQTQKDFGQIVWKNHSSLLKPVDYSPLQ